MAAPAFASSANVSTLAEADAGELAPGDYRWEPSLAPDGPVNMVIDLTSQRAFVYRDGKLIGVSTISSGKPGHETPTGTFTVLEKQRDHHSNKYDDAPMPYMQRLTWDGVAMHGGHPRGHPASHGCIRLPMGFAAALFKEETRGMKVVITGRAPGREETLMANRANARTSHETSGPKGTDELQATQFSSGQSDSNAPPEPPCCEPVAIPEPTVQAAPSPECSIPGEAADETADGSNESDVSRNPDQLQIDNCKRGYDQSQDDLERAPAVPTESTPPPPG